MKIRFSYRPTRAAVAAAIVVPAAEPVGCAARTRATAMPLRLYGRCARRTRRGRSGPPAATGRREGARPAL